MKEIYLDAQENYINRYTLEITDAYVEFLQNALAEGSAQPIDTLPTLTADMVERAWMWEDEDEENTNILLKNSVSGPEEYSLYKFIRNIVECDIWNSPCECLTDYIDWTEHQLSED